MVIGQDLNPAQSHSWEGRAEGEDSENKGKE